MQFLRPADRKYKSIMSYAYWQRCSRSVYMSEQRLAQVLQITKSHLVAFLVGPHVVLAYTN